MMKTASEWKSKLVFTVYTLAGLAQAAAFYLLFCMALRVSCGLAFLAFVLAPVTVLLGPWVVGFAIGDWTLFAIVYGSGRAGVRPSSLDGFWPNGHERLHEGAVLPRRIGAHVADLPRVFRHVRRHPSLPLAIRVEANSGGSAGGRA